MSRENALLKQIVQELKSIPRQQILEVVFERPNGSQGLDQVKMILS